MKKTLIALTVMLAFGLSASTASALSVGDANYIGRIVDGVPPGNFEDNMINSLLVLGAGAAPVACVQVATEQCDRLNSTINVAGFASASETGMDKDESGSATVDVTGFTYLLAKYGANTGDQFSLVWYVGNLSGNQTIVPSSGLSHTTLFNPGVTVPDGGATLGLLGLGMLGLGYLRRRRQ